MKRFKQVPRLVHIMVKMEQGGGNVPVFPKEVRIGTISGGIVNFGGAVIISPISVTTSSSGSGSGNTGKAITNEIIDLIRRG